MKEPSPGAEYYHLPDTQKNLIESQAAIHELEAIIGEARGELETTLKALEAEAAAVRKTGELDAFMRSMQDTVEGIAAAGKSPDARERREERERRIEELRQELADIQAQIAKIEEMKQLKEAGIESILALEKKFHRLKKMTGKWPRIQA